MCPHPYRRLIPAMPTPINTVLLGPALAREAGFLVIPDGAGFSAAWRYDSGYAPHCLVVGTSGGGKDLALDTPIPTPSGWTTMGEIKDNDLLFGSNGQVCRVVKAHDILLGEPCYE